MGPKNGLDQQQCNAQRMIEEIHTNTTIFKSKIDDTHNNTETIKSALENSLDDLISMVNKLTSTITGGTRLLIGFFLVSWFIDHFDINTFERMMKAIAGVGDTAKAFAERAF